MPLEEHWYRALERLKGEEETTAKPVRMADFHQARQAHQGQFLTSKAVSGLLWSLVTPAIEISQGCLSPVT